MWLISLHSCFHKFVWFCFLSQSSDLFLNLLTMGHLNFFFQNAIQYHEVVLLQFHYVLSWHRIEIWIFLLICWLDWIEHFLASELNVWSYLETARTWATGIGTCYSSILSNKEIQWWVFIWARHPVSSSADLIQSYYYAFSFSSGNWTKLNEEKIVTFVKLAFHI